MCMTVEEMNQAMRQIQEWKRIKEEAEDNILALNVKVIEFLQEMESCGVVDKKGKPIRKFVGEIHKAVYSQAERESIDKTEVKKILSEEDYQKVRKVSVYHVLRVS